MLKGWTLPQTATGKSALVTPPPWHYSGEIICADFTTDPDRVVSLLPPGIDPLPDNPGKCCFVFAHWCSASDNDPRVIADPARGQYKEAFCVVYGLLNGEEVARVPYIWVDNDLSLVRGLIQGFPKKQGQIFMTQPVEIGQGGMKKQTGSCFSAHVSGLNRRLATLSVKLDTEKEQGFFPEVWTRPMIHTRLWPSVDTEAPAVYEFQRGKLANIEIGKVFSGDAQLEFGDSEFEELIELQPESVKQGYVHSFAFTYLEGGVSKIEK